MPQENVELVQRAYEAFDTDLDGLLELLDPDIEWVSPDDSIEPGRRRGHRGVRDAFSATAMAWGHPTHTPVEFTDAGDKVLVTVKSLGDPSFEGVSSVSCPSASFCAAGISPGYALIYNGKSWSAPKRVEGAEDVTCVSASFCMGQSPRLAVTYAGGSWSAPVDLHTPIDEPVRSVSCASASFCVAVGGSHAYVYRPSKSEQHAAGASVKLQRIRVTSGSLLVVVKNSRAGTVTITGRGIRKVVKHLAAGTHNVTLALTAAGLIERKTHNSIKLSVSLKTTSKTVSNSEIVKL